MSLHEALSRPTAPAALLLVRVSGASAMYQVRPCTRLPNVPVPQPFRPRRVCTGSDPLSRSSAVSPLTARSGSVRRCNRRSGEGGAQRRVAGDIGRQAAKRLCNGEVSMNGHIVSFYAGVAVGCLLTIVVILLWAAHWYATH